MRRFVFTLLTAGLTALAANAHFVFILPDPSGGSATVVFSDALEPDEGVAISKIAGLKLTARDTAGKDIPLQHKTAEHSLTAAVPGSGSRVVFGSVRYGVMTKGDAPPFLLAYHPKAVVGTITANPIVIGDQLPVELVPVREGSSVRLKFLAGGKPVPDAEVNLVKPDDSKAKIKTGTDGLTPAIDGAGRYGAWAKYSESKAGELDGKKYAEVRHYATLVFETAVPTSAPAAATFPPLPQGVSSLGAIASDGYLYVYGGHAGVTHSYDTASVLGTFHRLKIDGGKKWEELPGGPKAQGMNLAAHGGKVYRVGGMSPRNAPGTPADNHSLTDAAAFNPASGAWEELPPLPAGRSSHDIVAVGDKLVVVGGWQMGGKGKASKWHDTTLILDLSAKQPKWEAVPQPFKRRALTAAAVGTKVYVLGGLGAEKAELTVNVFDVESRQWTTGPALPAAGGMGFSPAAATVGGQVVVNTLGGPIYRLTVDGTAWEKVGDAATKRMVHRMIPHGPDAVLLVGGASRGKGNVAEIEVVKLAAQGEKVAAAAK